MSKKINLEEILKKHSNICIDDRENVVEAMKEACKQLLELAAENAEITVKLKENCNELSLLDEWTTYIVDKQSILNTINQIE